MLRVCGRCQILYKRPDTGDTGHCAPCSAIRKAEQPTTAQKGLGSRWQIAAREQIRREPICEWCGATKDLTADHVVPRALGGTIEDGLRTLCRRCNSSRGAGRKESK